MVNPHVHPSKKTKTTVEKYNKIALKFWMDGLSSPIQESVKDYTSTKDLWFKLEEEYQKKNQDKEKEAKFKDEKKEENRYELHIQVKESTLHWKIVMNVMMMKLFL